MIILERCKVLSFGTLENFSYSFNSGLNTFMEANGFGKSTFVAFIRAMFYGFPRSNKSSLEKDYRRKYLPWQGGVYGGWLEWSFDEKTYRVERSFGLTPRDDIFKIYRCTDTELRLTDEYSSNLGEEIFGLDSESFERTICLTQNRLVDGLYSNQIHAKLSNLIEDTNDINNYDSAVERLRQKRSSFIPYRGNDGKAAKARRQMLRLENEIEECENARVSLEENNENLSSISEQISDKTTEIDLIRDEIRSLSAVDAHNALVREKKSLTAAVEKSAVIVKKLKEKYPDGFPTPDELKQLDKALDNLSESSSLTVDHAYREARETVINGKAHFSDGFPSHDTLDELNEKALEYNRIESSLEALSLSDEEEKIFNGTDTVFNGKSPSDEEINLCREWIRTREDAISQSKTLCLTQSETAKLNNLVSSLKIGKPTDDSLEEQYNALNKIESLNKETNELKNAISEQLTSKKNKRKLLILTSTSAILCIIISVVLFLSDITIPAAVTSVISLFLMIISLYILLNSKIIQSLREKDNTDINSYNRRILKNQLECERLENLLNEFLDPFSLGDLSPADALNQIQSQYDELKTLLDRENEYKSSKDKFNSVVEDCNSKLNKYLSQYFTEIDDYSLLINKLVLLSERYKILKAKKIELEEKSNYLKSRLSFIRNEMNAFFEQYHYMVAEGDENRMLVQIREDSEGYQRALHTIEQTNIIQTELEQKKTEQKNIIADILSKYQLSDRIMSRETARELWEDRREYYRTVSELIESKGKLDKFLSENAGVDFSIIESISVSSLEDKKILEKNLQNELRVLKDDFAKLQSKSEQLGHLVNQLPALRENFNEAKEVAECSEESARILDIVLDKLRQSKEELSDKYLGPLKQNYIKTIRQLMPESDEKNILIDGELNLEVDMAGAPREIGYYSSGMADMMMLGMRVALVETLYNDNQPFMIFDDPFVNLDDEHMKLALNWMNEMTKDRQILYFVCHSGRTNENPNTNEREYL